MGLPAQKKRYSVEEYFELELAAVERHEYQEGDILAMSGGSPAHSFIAANFSREAGNSLKGKPCRIAESNLRIRISRTQRYVYPDASIICGPLEFDAQDIKQHTILNPRVVIEVLSPTTEAYDRGDKFMQYRKIRSLDEYILISQDRPNFESWQRQSDGAWSIVNSSALDAIAKIRCLGIEIPMTEIYAGIEWLSPPAAADNDA